MKNPSDSAVDTLGRYAAVGDESGIVAILDLSASAAIVASFQVQGGGSLVRLCWSHHKYGRVIAIALEAELRVWRDADSKHGYRETFRQSFPAGLNAISWAPNEFGPMLAAAGGDGQVTILSAKNAELSQWDAQAFAAHPQGGCHAVSWSPALAPGALLQMPLGVPQHNGPAASAAGITVPAPRVVTCGPERSIRIWRYLNQDRHWLQEQELADFPVDVTTVRDVAWAPNPGIPFGYVAAASDEGLVGVWLQDGTEGKWHHTALPTRWPCPVCRVGWSSAGTVLSVAAADGSNTLWKETVTGEWVTVLETRQ